LEEGMITSNLVPDINPRINKEYKPEFYLNANIFISKG
jgi:hypothetical protein